MRLTATVFDELRHDGGSQQRRWIDATRLTPASSPVDVEVTTEELGFVMSIHPDCCNAHGTLHGGVAAWALGAITRVHAASRWGSHAAAPATVSLTVSYLKGPRRGATVGLRSWCRRLGRRTAFFDAAIQDTATGADLVRATHIVRRPDTSTHKAKL